VAAHARREIVVVEAKGRVTPAQLRERSTKVVVEAGTLRSAEGDDP